MSAVITVATPEAFSGALGHADERVRHAAWRLVAERHPDALDAVRADAERALGTLLAHLDPHAPNPNDHLLVRALVALDDDRVAPDLQQVLMYASDSDVLALVIAALARLDRDGSTLLRGLLADASRPDLQGLAAQHLDAAQLPSAPRLRAALVQLRHARIDASEVPSPAEPGMLQPYRHELAGAFAHQARQAAEAHGTPALAALADDVARLTPESRVWLLRWAGRSRSLPGLNLIDQVLADATSTNADLEVALDAVRLAGPLAATLSTRLLDLRARLAQRHDAPEPLRAALDAATRHAERHEVAS